MFCAHGPRASYLTTIAEEPEPSSDEENPEDLLELSFKQDHD